MGVMLKNFDAHFYFATVTTNVYIGLHIFYVGLHSGQLDVAVSGVLLSISEHLK